MSGSALFVSARRRTKDPEPADHVGCGDVLPGRVDAPRVRAGLLGAELVLGIPRGGRQELGHELRVPRVRDVGDDDTERVPREIGALADDLRVVDAEGEPGSAAPPCVRDQARRRFEMSQNEGRPPFVS